jgi:hypothetical protein
MNLVIYNDHVSQKSAASAKRRRNKMGTTPQIDLAAVQAEVAKLSDEGLREELLKFRVRQKKQQKKMQGSASQKAYQAKQREKQRLLKERAIQLGMWDEINEKAEALAEEELAKDAVAEETA